MVEAGNVAVGRASCMIRKSGNRFSLGTNAKAFARRSCSRKEMRSNIRPSPIGSWSEVDGSIIASCHRDCRNRV